MSNPGTTDYCQAVKINCAGAPVSKSLKANAKDIGRLLGPTIPGILCNDTLDDLQDVVRGDPGSVFTFKCPAGCTDGGLLVGSGL